MGLEIIDFGRLSDPDFAPFHMTEIDAVRGELSGGRSDLGIAFAVPVFYIVGAAAVTGAATAYAWLERDEWTTDEYNEQMSKMHATLLLWDKLGWTVPGEGSNACWGRNASRRTEWLSFLSSFKGFYGKHGKHSVYLPDGIEMEARKYVKDLAAWGEWLESKCGIGLVKPSEESKFTLEDGLKLGAWIVGGIVLLNVISAARDATGSRRRY